MIQIESDLTGQTKPESELSVFAFQSQGQPKPQSERQTVLQGAIDAEGCCLLARQTPSPNFNLRPESSEITLLVIHNISLPSACFGTSTIQDFFQNQLDCSLHSSFASLQDVQVSAHFLIRRDGELLQFVSTDKRAWHAGVSSFDGRSGCNDFSIGVELEGCDELPFETSQYSALIALTEALMAHYPIRHIAGHNEIAPGRKTDPGPCFDWQRYASDLPFTCSVLPLVCT